MKIFDITEEDKMKIIERTQRENSPGAFLLLAYTQIIETLKDGDSICPNLVYISEETYSWIHEAPKRYGFDVLEEDWTMFLVNKAPMTCTNIPENKIYWFDSFEEKKQFENNLKLEIQSKSTDNKGSKLFDGDKYVTQGVRNKIDVELQLTIWSLIERLKEKELVNSLQVFELTEHEGKQKIEHKQEQSEYCKEYTMDSEAPVKAKILVIDSKTYSTMILAEEY